MKKVDKAIASEANLLIAVLLFIGTFFIFFLGLKINHWDENKFLVLASIVVSAMVAFGDFDSVKIQTTKLILFRGTETGVRAPTGFYFLFWFWTLDKSETQSKQKFGLTFLAFPCQAKGGKVLKAGGKGRWRISNEVVYKNEDAETILETILELVQKTTMRLTATLDYSTIKRTDPQILGQDLGEKVLADGIFKDECIKLGVEITSLILDAIAEDLKQENLDAYFDQLMKKAKSEYPDGHRFTHNELKEIKADVQVQIGRAKKIIANTDLLGRYNIDE